LEKGHPLEVDLGMEFYSTQNPALGGRLKNSVEDFIVEEITTDRIRLQIEPFTQASSLEPSGERDRFITMNVQKSGLTTMDVTIILASELKLPRQMVTYAGLKDKRAITVQRMSVPSRVNQLLQSLKLNRIHLSEPHYTRHPVQIGDLWGNNFTIHLVDIILDEDEALATAQKLANQPLLNYFGVQRFGITRPPTHLIGKALVVNDYERAVRIMLTTTNEYEPEELTDLRIRIGETFEFNEKILADFPRDLRNERGVISSLIKHPADYERAVSTILPRIQTLMIHAYQSYLFNRLLGLRVSNGLPINLPVPGDFLIQLDAPHSGRDSWIFVTERNLESMIERVQASEYGVACPVPGYSTKLPPSKQTDMLSEILKSEGIRLLDFRNATNKNLDSAGGLHLSSIDLQGREAESTDQGILMKFSLRKGSYATVVMREIMRNEPINRI